jgi:ABC-type glycerol-3-phosphate transport system substrate-binding protein
MGEKSWSKSGQEVFYTFSVPSDGFYNFGFKYLQAGKANANVYRRMRVDGEVLCTVYDTIKFDYTTSWKTLKMSYPIYLSQGEHTLSLEVNGGVYSEYIDILYETVEEVNSLALEIKKLTGGNTASKNTEWDILNYFPKIQQQLGGYIEQLEEVYNKVLEFNDQKGDSQELISLAGAIRNLVFLKKEPDLIPKRFSLLNEGASSVVKELSKALAEFENQPLQLDQIYVYTDEKDLPNYKVSFFTRIAEGFKRFFFSFLPKNKSFSKNDTVLRVWVNRSRNYVELLQKITDNDFTAKTGIKVDFSIMPDEQKLILSNASGTSPDIALTISNWLPFELGIRGASLDLRQFEDFGEVIRDFSPGALLPYIYEKGCYGLPETQDFYVLFYRKDIMEKLNLPIPDTWDEVMLILPELQRYGMNFYLPIAGASGFKPVTVTTPFIYQHHGELYSEDGFRTALDEPNSLKAIELMTKLFTLYGVELQVPNFFEHFRSGLSPIGISNFTTYVQLNVGAPELKNSWDISLAPGIKNEDGVVERWHAGSAQACMIFKNTQNPESSWEFIKWWMSRETQSSFGYQVQALYGKEYMYNSANLRAFGQIPIPSEHKTIALQQWEWMKEIPKTPAGYMLERELSNIWIKIVLQGKNTRAAVDESVIRINKEISRKLEEFGYSKDGVKIKDYYIPSIEDIIGWRNYYEEKQ